MKAGIPRSPVDSSSIRSVGYDAGNRTLAVEFKSGSLYHYHEVPADTYDDLRQAESAGRFVNQHVKDKFTAERQS